MAHGRCETIFYVLAASGITALGLAVLTLVSRSDDKATGHLPYIEDSVHPSDFHTFVDYFPDSAANTLETWESPLYYGRNVIWVGTKGRMFRTGPKYVEHISGNIWDHDKLSAIVAGIDQAPHRIKFYAPYGQISLIETQDIAESILYEEDDGIRYSTDDEELDDYLVLDMDEFLDTYYCIDEDDPEAVAILEELEERKNQAVEEGWGDLGQFSVQIRDGNHRGFGALIAGEPYIYVRIMDNQYHDLKQGDALLEMLD